MHWIGWFLVTLAIVPMGAIVFSREARELVRTKRAPNLLSWLGVLLMGLSLVLAPRIPLVRLGVPSLLVFAAGSVKTWLSK